MAKRKGRLVSEKPPFGPLLQVPLAPIVEELKIRIILFERGVLDLWDQGEWKTYEEALKATKHLPARKNRCP